MALCDCGYEAPTGCACAYKDSECVAWEPVDGFPTERQPVPIASPQETNIFSCTGSGMQVLPPSRFVTPPQVQVYRSSTFTALNQQFMELAFNTQQWDTDNMWEAADSTLISINTAGYYFCYASVRWEGRDNGPRSLSLILGDANAIAQDQFYVNTSDEMSQSVEGIYRFEAGEFFKVVVFQDHTGGNPGVGPGSESELFVQAANATTLNDRCKAGAVFLGDL